MMRARTRTSFHSLFCERFEVAGSLDNTAVGELRTISAQVGSAKGRTRNRGDEHNAILDACASRDPNRAVLLLHNHLARTANFIALQMTGQTISAHGPICPRRLLSKAKSFETFRAFSCVCSCR